MTGGVGGNVQAPVGAFITASALTQQYGSTCFLNGAGTVLTWQLMLQFPMKYVHDIFKKMPLNRGALWQLVVGLNVPCSWSTGVTILAGTQGVVTQYSSATNVITPNQFMPFMVAQPSVLGTGATCGSPVFNAAIAGTAATINWTAAVGGLVSTTTMCCTTFKLSSELTDRYTQNSKKRIVYWDFIRQQPSSALNQISTNTIVANITPGQSRVRGLLIVPYISGSAAGNASNGTGMVGVSTLLSPFTSAGATVTPYSYLNNLNVMIGGRAIFQKNFQYRSDIFQRETGGINAPSGDALDAFRANLIDESEWNAGYGYYYINLERKNATDDNLPVSVDVTFNNAISGSVTSMSYNFFLFYEREFSLDCATGKIFV